MTDRSIDLQLAFARTVPDHMGLAVAATALEAGTVPGEILLMPAGTVQPRPHDGREAWSNANPEAVIAASRELSADLVIDYEHQTEFAPKNGQPAPAAGWIKGLFKRDGAIWARVEWTERASAFLKAREYRFVSPTFLFDKATRQVKRIVGAALTNDPALFMKAIAKATTEDTDTMDLKALAAALGLPETAGEEEILAAAKAHREALATAATAAGIDVKPLEGDVAKLGETLCETARAQASATTRLAARASTLGLKADATLEEILEKATASAGGDPDPRDFVPRAEFDAVKNRLDKVETSDAEEKATAAVDQAIRDGKLTPASRDWGLSYARKDPDGFRAYCGTAPQILGDGTVIPVQPDGDKSALTADEKAVCRNLGLSEEAFLKAKNEEVA